MIIHIYLPLYILTLSLISISLALLYLDLPLTLVYPRYPFHYLGNTATFVVFLYLIKKINGLDYTILSRLQSLNVLHHHYMLRSVDASGQLPWPVTDLFIQGIFMVCVLILFRIHAYRFQLRCSFLRLYGFPAVYLVYTGQMDMLILSSIVRLSEPHLEHFSVILSSS